MVVFRQSGDYSDTGCIRAKVVVFGQKWLLSGKVVLFGQIRLYSVKCGCIQAKFLSLGKIRSNRAKWFY